MVRTVEHFINGSRLRGHGTRSGELLAPESGAHRAVVPYADAAGLDLAVQAAREALPQWAGTPALERARILNRLRERIASNMDTLADTVSAEHGKTLAEARGSVTRGLEVVEYACGAPELLKGQHTGEVSRGVDSYSLFAPVGVCAGITPFNFPAMVPLWMFPMALACGNTFLLKPSERVPSTALMLAELAFEAGVPPGVLNVVQGDAECVDAILAHPGIDAVSFVGSTPVARHVYATAARHGKRVQALGGAKNHAVIMPDADLEQAAEGLTSAAFGSAGERCMAISAALAVGEATADALREHLAPRLRALRIGPYHQDGVEMGPLISRAHLERVRAYIDRGVTEGAELVTDGRELALQGYEGGNFLGPTLFDRVTPQMTIYREEIFGPVLSLLRVESYEDALALVNDNEYGNGTAIFTRSGETARDFTARCRIGMVGVNVPVPVPAAYHSFAGWKSSLFGDLGMHGPDGVRFYTRRKTVTSRWPSPA